jgi:DNA repair exonuclease SbcCD ATPase subunit
MAMNAMIMGLSFLLGIAVLVVVLIVYLRKKSLGFSDAVLSVIGLILMGTPVWTSIRIIVSPQGGIEAQLTQRVEQLESEQAQVVDRVQTVESVAEQVEGRVRSVETATEQVEGRVQTVESATEQVESRVQTVETTTEQVRQEVGILTEKFFRDIDNIRAVEASASDEIRQTLKDKQAEYAEGLENMPRDERLRLEERLTRKHLGDLNITLRELKAMLHQAGYSAGEIDEEFDLTLSDAVKELQRSHNLVIDGIFGKDSYRALAADMGR